MMQGKKKTLLIVIAACLSVVLIASLLLSYFVPKYYASDEARANGDFYNEDHVVPDWSVLFIKEGLTLEQVFRRIGRPCADLGYGIIILGYRCWSGNAIRIGMMGGSEELEVAYVYYDTKYGSIQLV